MRVNIGAGSKELDGWVSLGLSDHHAIRSDIRVLAIPDGAITEALACHVVEHIAPAQVPAMFADWFRAMAPGAELAIEGPDLKKCCHNFLAAPDDIKMGLRGIYGSVIDDDLTALHRWGMTVPTLRRLLEAAGFIKVREEPPQFHGRKNGRDLRVVCRKPG